MLHQLHQFCSILIADRDKKKQQQHLFYRSKHAFRLCICRVVCFYFYWSRHRVRPCGNAHSKTVFVDRSYITWILHSADGSCCSSALFLFALVKSLLLVIFSLLFVLIICAVSGYYFYMHSEHSNIHNIIMFFFPQHRTAQYKYKCMQSAWLTWPADEKISSFMCFAQFTGQLFAIIRFYDLYSALGYSFSADSKKSKNSWRKITFYWIKDEMKLFNAVRKRATRPWFAFISLPFRFEMVTNGTMISNDDHKWTKYSR